ncbi:MAG: SGNH/GDSL hydrolase family protein, partial [Nitrospinaceae bacterium]
MSNLTHPPRNTSATGLPLRKKFLFTLIPFLIFFGSAEAVLRMTVGLDQIRYKCHYPILDNQYCPNVEAIQKLTGAVIRSNAEGLLDKEYSKARTPGTFRVAVLGDSFTAGEEVKDGFEFHALWEKELTRRLGRPVEFINFGVAGIGPWKELQTYHLRARAYHPDLTLLAFYWENDVDNAISKLKSGGPNPLLEEYPVTSWWEQAKVVRKRFNQWLWNNLAIYQFTHTRYRILEHQFHLTFRPEWRKDPEEFLPENKPADASPEVEEDAPANPQPENAGRIDNEFLQTYPPLPGIPPIPRP